MTGVADTRLLLTLEFPPTLDVKQKVEELTQKEIARHLLAPSITRLRLLKGRGMRTAALEEEEALTAGELLLSQQDVPTADALIASFVRTGVAEYVVTDDPHYKTLGIKTKWF
jgi:pimeloyl-CoA synthetase